MSFFESTVLVLLTLILLLAAAVFTKVCLPSEEERTDAAVEREMERDKASRNIDEGIANIMSYSVNGKTGFEQDEF